MSLTELRLDWQNPRLPEEMQDPAKTQEELLLYIDKRYNPLEVAQSIARHGYFESEPLIVVPEGGHYTVVEGNRRLTALLGLTDSELRSKLIDQTRGWRRLPESVPLPERIPVVEVQDRKQVAPLLGFRHISGLAEWEPFAQARYIFDLVESGETFQQVADLVGRDTLEVRSMYRDHEILRQGSQLFGLDVNRAQDDFGIFNAAMGIRNLRVYIDAPTAGNTDAEHWPLDEDAHPRLERLLRYMYGDERGRGRVLQDSRKLRDLGKVLADASGRGELALEEPGATIDDALEALAEPTEQARKRLVAALNAVQRVSIHAPANLDAINAKLAEDLRTAVENLLRMADGAK